MYFYYNDQEKLIIANYIYKFANWKILFHPNSIKRYIVTPNFLISSSQSTRKQPLRALHNEPGIIPLIHPGSHLSSSFISPKGNSRELSPCNQERRDVFRTLKSFHFSRRLLPPSHEKNSFSMETIKRRQIRNEIRREKERRIFAKLAFFFLALEKCWKCSFRMEYGDELEKKENLGIHLVSWYFTRFFEKYLTKSNELKEMFEKRKKRNFIRLVDFWSIYLLYISFERIINIK